MGYRRINAAEEGLELLLRRLTDDNELVNSLVEAVKELAAAKAEDLLDAEFNRGDYRS